MEPEELAPFLADYDEQRRQIEAIYERLGAKARQMASGGVSPELVDSVGYWLHNLYCAFEDLFKLVAAFFENEVAPGGRYHAALLRRMRTPIPGIRPALLTDDSFRHLDELRGFRHVFRHAYGYGLDDERVRALLERVFRHRPVVEQDLDAFREALASASSRPVDPA